MSVKTEHTRDIESAQRPTWRRWLAYLVLGATILGVVAFVTHRAPRDLQLAFVFSGYELEVAGQRLDRQHVRGLEARFLSDTTPVARASLSFAQSGAPLRSGLVAVPLTPGQYDVTLRVELELPSGVRLPHVSQTSVEVLAERDTLLVDVRP